MDDSRYGATEVGFRPDDTRPELSWLAPDALYRCPDQTVQLADHAEKLRRAFEDGDSAAFDGNAERASGNRLRSVRVELSEAWPDTAIHLRCTHADYPGLELVRALRP